MKLLILALAFGLAIPAQSAKLKGVTMQDEITVNGTKLVLNGMALREKKKFGMWWNVYIGGLYLKAKSSDEKAIIADPSIKQLVMEYVRAVDKSTLAEGWGDAFKRACIQSCSEMKKPIAEFKKMITAVKKKTRVTLIFHKDKVEVSSTMPGDSGGSIQGEAFRTNLLNVFIGEKAPPTVDFRKNILGLK